MARKAGSKNITAEVVASPGRCPRCGSTRRRRVVRSEREIMPAAMRTTSGETYNVIARRVVHCADCGEPRREKAFEFLPSLTAGGGINAVAEETAADIAARR